MLDCQSHLFSIPAGVHYLNCASRSPLPERVLAAGRAGVDLKSAPWSFGAEALRDPPEKLREVFARLVGTDPLRVALIPSVSYGLAIAAHNAPLAAGKNVVLPAGAFPSELHPWRERCRQTGATLRLVPRPPGPSGAAAPWSEALLGAIDADTAVVNLAPLHWADGTRFHLHRVARRARQVGAWLVVDGTQALGAEPFDYAEIQPDLLVSAGYKWLFGPWQCCLAVVGDRLAEGRPFEWGYENRLGGGDFSQGIPYPETYRPGGARYDVGEYWNPVNVGMLTEGINLILSLGVARIAEYCGALGAVLGEALPGELGFSIAPAEERAAHLFAVGLPDGMEISAVLPALEAARVYVSQRGPALRVSPNVYNTPEDMQALAAVLRGLATG